MKENFIPVQVKNDYSKVFIGDVNYILRQGRKIRVSTTKRIMEYYANITDIRLRLDRRFYKCHSGLYVNLEQIRHTECQEIQFFSGDSITIGLNNIRHTKRAYKSHLEKIFLSKRHFN